jgi:hypothetical protein
MVNCKAEGLHQARELPTELATRTKMMIVPTRMKAPHVGISTGTGPWPSPRLKRDMPEACSKPRRTTWPTYATIVNYLLDKQVTNEKRTETALVVEEKLKKKWWWVL